MFQQSQDNLRKIAHNKTPKCHIDGENSPSKTTLDQVEYMYPILANRKLNSKQIKYANSSMPNPSYVFINLSFSLN